MEKSIKVLAVGDPAVAVYVNESFKILEQFTEATGYPVLFDIVPWENYYDTLMKNLQSDHSSYDVVMVAGYFWLKDFVSSGYLEALSPLDEDVLPVIRQEMMIEGKTFLVPSFCDGHLVLYRPSILEPIFGKISECITTDEYGVMAAKLGENAIAMKAHPSEIFLDFLPFLRAEGVEPFAADGSVNVNRPEAVEALKAYIALKVFALQGTEEFGNEGVKEAFQHKKCAMMVTWGGQIGEVLSPSCESIEDVGFAAFKTAWNVTWSFGIPKSASDKEAAEKLLSYLGSSSVDRLVGGFAGSPVRKSTYELDRAVYPWYDIHLKLIEEYAKPLPSLNNFGAMAGHLYEQVYLAFTGEKTAEEALQAAQVAIEKVK